MHFFKKKKTYDHMVFRFTAGRYRNVPNLYFKVFRRCCGISFVIFCRKNITGMDIFQQPGIFFHKKPQTGS